MLKLIVDVTIPANGRTYEFRLDAAMTAGMAKEYIAAYIVQAERGAVMFSEDLILGDITAARRLDDSTPLYGNGVRSGHMLTLA